MSGSPIDEALPAPYEIDRDQLDRAESEDPFMFAGVELLKEALSYAALLAGICRQDPLPRDPAIRAGLLVRAARLARTTLRDTCEDEGEQQLALHRQLMDTVGTLLYLLDDKDGSRHTAFVQSGLVAERETLRAIADQQVRSGEVIAIEERMKRSIEALARAGGVSLADLPSRRDIGWPSAESLVGQFGPTAYPAYRMGSAALHGTWQDVERNYLERDGTGFRIRFDPVPPRPQPLLAATALLVVASSAFLATQDSVLQKIAPLLVDLDDRRCTVDDLHEQFLQRLT
jgi:hypothetical protein